MALIAADGGVTKVDLPQQLKPFGLLTTTGRHLIVQLSQDTQLAGRRLPAETPLAYDVGARPPDDSKRVQIVYSPREGEYLNDSTFGVAATRDAVHFIVTRGLVPHLMPAKPGRDGGHGVVIRSAGRK